MRDSNAWLVAFRGGHRAAVGELELMHVLLDRPQLFPVLEAPAHCRHVILWEGHMLPVLDLSRWLGEAPGEDDNTHLGVFRYRPGPGEALRYGSLVIEGAPRQVLVNDSQACDLSGEQATWHQLAHACFDFAGEPIPVLNLRRIFDQPLQ